MLGAINTLHLEKHSRPIPRSFTLTGTGHWVINWREANHEVDFFLMPVEQLF